MYQQRTDVRTEHLREQQEQVRAARSLVESFPELKTLTAMLAYFGPDGETCYSELKCTFNLAYAKALFLFSCSNPECIGGSFDLSSELAHAVTGRLERATGESRCRGWKSKTTIDRIYCEHLLRYTLNFEYCADAPR